MRSFLYLDVEQWSLTHMDDCIVFMEDIVYAWTGGLYACIGVQLWAKNTPHAAELYSNTIIYAYGIVERARWAHLSASHHIKPEPLNECLMW